MLPILITPSSWSNGSELTSQGNFVVDVLENTLGFQVGWSINLNGQNGKYWMFNDSIGPIYNQFPRETTFVNSQVTLIQPPSTIQIFAQPYNYTSKDDGVVPVAIKTHPVWFITPVVTFATLLKLSPLT